VRVEGLSDAALLAAMGEGDAWAWGEFYTRFRPVLAAFARRAGATPEEREVCVDEVLADQGARLTIPGPRCPPNSAPTSCVPRGIAC
jgi:hypothetical protein